MKIARLIERLKAMQDRYTSAGIDPEIIVFGGKESFEISNVVDYHEKVAILCKGEDEQRERGRT